MEYPKLKNSVFNFIINDQEENFGFLGLSFLNIVSMHCIVYDVDICYYYKERDQCACI